MVSFLGICMILCFLAVTSFASSNFEKAQSILADFVVDCDLHPSLATCENEADSVNVVLFDSQGEILRVSASDSDIQEPTPSNFLLKIKPTNVDVQQFVDACFASEIYTVGKDNKFCGNGTADSFDNDATVGVPSFGDFCLWKVCLANETFVTINLMGSPSKGNDNVTLEEEHVSSESTTRYPFLPVFSGKDSKFIRSVSLQNEKQASAKDAFGVFGGHVMFGDVVIEHFTSDGRLEASKVCDGDWGTSEARLVCGELGFSSGIPTVGGRFSNRTLLRPDSGLVRMHCPDNADSVESCLSKRLTTATDQIMQRFRLETSSSFECQPAGVICSSSSNTLTVDVLQRSHHLECPVDTDKDEVERKDEFDVDEILNQAEIIERVEQIEIDTVDVDEDLERLSDAMSRVFGTDVEEADSDYVDEKAQQSDEEEEEQERLGLTTEGTGVETEHSTVDKIVNAEDPKTEGDNFTQHVLRVTAVSANDTTDVVATLDDELFDASVSNADSTLAEDAKASSRKTVRRSKRDLDSILRSTISDTERTQAQVDLLYGVRPEKREELLRKLGELDTNSRPLESEIKELEANLDELDRDFSEAAVVSRARVRIENCTSEPANKKYSSGISCIIKSDARVGAASAAEFLLRRFATIFEKTQQLDEVSVSAAISRWNAEREQERTNIAETAALSGQLRQDLSDLRSGLAALRSQSRMRDASLEAASRHAKLLRGAKGSEELAEMVWTLAGESLSEAAARNSYVNRMSKKFLKGLEAAGKPKQTREKRSVKGTITQEKVDEEESIKAGLTEDAVRMDLVMRGCIETDSEVDGTVNRAIEPNESVSSNVALAVGISLAAIIILAGCLVFACIRDKKKRIKKVRDSDGVEMAENVENSQIKSSDTCEEKNNDNTSKVMEMTPAEEKSSEKSSDAGKEEDDVMMGNEGTGATNSTNSNDQSSGDVTDDESAEMSKSTKGNDKSSDGNGDSVDPDREQEEQEREERIHLPEVDHFTADDGEPRFSPREWTMERINWLNSIGIVPMSLRGDDREDIREDETDDEVDEKEASRRTQDSGF